MDIFIYRTPHTKYIYIQVAEVVTTEDLLGWNFTPRQCARFFKWLNKWQKMRDHLVSKDIWDEMKDKIEHTVFSQVLQLVLPRYFILNITSFV